MSESQKKAEARRPHGFDDVFAAETDYIRARWQSAYDGKGSRRMSGEASVPTTRHGLVGLSFSGGGIRSATFHLGVLQALHRWGVLRHVDFLSTVSGGGFIASCLGSLGRSGRLDLLFGKPPEQGDAPSRQKGESASSVEPAAISYLRNNSNYLAPSGFLDFVRILGLVAKGFVGNLILLLPWLILGAWLASVLLPFRAAWPATPAAGFLATMILAGAWIGWVLLTPTLERIRSPKWRERFERSYGLGLLGIAGTAFFEIQPFLLERFQRLSTGSPTGNLGVAAVLGAVFLLSIAATQLIARLGGVASLLGALLTPLLAPALPFLIYLLILDGLTRDQLSVLPALMVAGTLLLFQFLFVNVNGTSMHGFYRDRLGRAYLLGVDERGGLEAERPVRLSEMCQGSECELPYHLINAALNLQSSDDPGLRGRNSDEFLFSQSFIGSDRAGYCRTTDMEDLLPEIGVGTAVAISAAAAAPNMGVYTSRSLAFLMALMNVRLGYWLPRPGFVDCWSEAASRGKVPKYRGARSALHFLLRPGPAQFYSEMFNRVHERGRSVNVSDGGHFENTGVFELLRRRCRFIVAGDAEADPGRRCGSLATLIRYARTDLGIDIDIRLDDLYPDSEGSSRQHCALGLVRYPPTGEEGPEEIGYLLYVKSTVTGGEDDLINEYRARNPDFPHQSTGDQFFEEDQFEAYRSLGEHIIDHTFRTVLGNRVEGDLDYAQFTRLLLQLNVSLAPAAARVEVESESNLAEAMSRIEASLRLPELTSYSHEIYPEHRPASERGGRMSTGLFRRVLHVVNEQLGLMERVYFALRLHEPRVQLAPSSRGWLNLFRRWSNAPSFRRAYLLCIPAYSSNFQQFCEVVLGIERHLSWRPAGQWDLSGADEPEPIRLPDEEPDLGENVRVDNLIIGIPDGPPPAEPSGPIRRLDEAASADAGGANAFLLASANEEHRRLRQELEGKIRRLKQRLEEKITAGTRELRSEMSGLHSSVSRVSEDLERVSEDLSRVARELGLSEEEEPEELEDTGWSLPPELWPSARAVKEIESRLNKGASEESRVDQLDQYVLYLSVTGGRADEIQAVAIGTALLWDRGDAIELCSLKLRIGYEGADIYQQALSSLNQYLRENRNSEKVFVVPTAAVQPRYRGWVATDVMTLEDIAGISAAGRSTHLHHE